MKMSLQLRTEFVSTLHHIRDVFNRVNPLTGPGRSLRYPDLHKLSEGLLLSAWTHWEELNRDLMIVDLATQTTSTLKCDVTKFRTKNASFRLAERMINHPDHPGKFVEWNDYDVVRDRAKSFLGTGHRFTALGNPLAPDLKILKKVRNAIAHRSDKAWADSIALVTAAPFNLAAKQRKGITPGRFISAHNWHNQRMLLRTLVTLESCAMHLVP